MIFQNLAINAAAFVLVLGFLIFAHESGHFFVAKLFKVRVLVFSFGFGKRLFGFRRGDTDYRISAIPLGGYVRMAGDTPSDRAGEGMLAPDTIDIATGDPAEFLSKPKWQRFLILLAGPAMNIIIAIAFVALISMVGTESLIIKPIIGELTSPNTPAARAGLQPGDLIVAVDGEKIESFEDLRLAVSLHAGTPLRVEYVRNGVRNVTTMTPVREDSEYGPVGRGGFRPWLDPIIGRVKPGSPAEKAGLRTGDRIAAVNGKPIVQLSQFDTAIDAVKGAALPMDIVRGGTSMHVVLPPVPVGGDQDDPYRGFIPPTEVHKLSLIPAIQDSFAQNKKMLRYAGAAIGRLVRGEGSVREFSGPLSIAKISGEMLRRGWMAVIDLMAMISLQLGIMNLLPIPVLDGGHIMILLIEGAARRELSIRVKERIQQVGFAVLAALMIVILYNDVITNVMSLRKG